MSQCFPLVTPIDGSTWWIQEGSSPAQIEGSIDRAKKAQQSWRSAPIDIRLAVVEKFVCAMVNNIDAYAEALCYQMGRPLSQCPGEIHGMADRARTMARLAEDSLGDIVPPEQDGFQRFIRREPLGLLLVLAPWNYPYLTAVNAVIPALLAGNAVLLKHSDQTPLVAEHFESCLRQAGLPEGVFQALYIDHDAVAGLIGDPRIDHVCFTGSLEGGKAVNRAVARRGDQGQFIGLGLELGGKDPGYVRADADLESAAAGLVDGAFFNSGQSCCGIERIYVHQSHYPEFIEHVTRLVRGYRLGNPLDPATNLGPVVRTRNAEGIRAQIESALAQGARQLVPPSEFPADTGSSAYLAPQALVDVDHNMELMREETFGPVVGIMSVEDDAQALELMNDSPYGLTASIWSQDREAVIALGDRLQTGTVFMNRCDFLDPMLAWTGQKSSGRGATLSQVGFEQLTRAKSYHLRTL
jgi:acyl-CoA reductase-like NAD-dependent aldehyde dehydrogenase